mmetsp:Transcript_21938/g.28405  ORF Transcript_21938/g.28405 Transcript_21938/m.28405 type:complete len:654 (-) Transcript_21938:293-2254(-)
MNYAAKSLMSGVLAFLLALEFCHPFRIVSRRTPRPTTRRELQRRNNQISHLFSTPNDAFLWHSKQELVRREFQNLTVEEIQKQLVVKGYAFQLADFSKRASLIDDDNFRVSQPTRVTGCTATVNIQVVLDIEGNKAKVEELRGTCDAFVSRGILALWSSACEKATADDILQLNPDQLPDKWGLRVALSRGRNDGLASMVRTTQGLIRKLLDEQNTNADKSLESILDQNNIHSNSHYEKENQTVALLLSGGVDSSVALNLLLRQGYKVTAFYLKIWLEDELAHLGQCPWEDDVEMCRSVCDQAGVQLEIINLQNEYKERVISYTVQQARQGKTPNPDIMCNSRIKFGCFYDAIEKREFDFVATGHYAQVVRDEKNNTVQLFRAPDPVKDQSYFLCALTQEQLQRVLFPIGHLEKSRVRELANEFQLPNRHRPDSQGLCFLGKVKFEEFLKAYLGESDGDILDAATGEVLGHHKGLWFHTVGQRKGIGKVLFPKVTARGPWYVVAKDPDRNIVFCSNQYDQELFDQPRSEFTVDAISWIVAGSTEQLPTTGTTSRMLMKIRHGPRLVEGSLEWISPTTGKIRLDQKDGGLAPGQYVVFYNEHAECLGGGVISERHWAKFLLSYDQQLRLFEADEQQQDNEQGKNTSSTEATFAMV